MNKELGIKNVVAAVFRPPQWRPEGRRYMRNWSAGAVVFFVVFFLSFSASETNAATIFSCVSASNQTIASFSTQAACTAACTTADTSCREVTTATPSGGAAVTSCPPGTVCLPNPLGTANVPVIVGRIIRVLSGGAGMIALLMFVYGGFQWLTSGGNAEKIKKGQAIILWSLIGLVVMFSSYIAARYIIETLVPAATR